MNYQPKVSRPRPEDTARIIEVWEASVRATHKFLAEDDIEFFRLLVREAISQGLEVGCIRDDSNEIVGFVATANAKIEMLFIHPAWRGRGIGRLLTQHAVTEARATSVDVNEQNEQAVGFYQRMGFVVQSRSELDGMGKPFPLLHMKLEQESVGLIASVWVE